MDLWRINDVVTWTPDIAITNYTSLIWTERFNTPGDFELKTPDVTTMLELLPLNSMVTLQDSRIVMIVETHSIKTDENGTSELTITGRSFDCILESRIVRGPYQAPYQTIQAWPPDAFLSLYLYNELGNNTTTNFLASGAGSKAYTDNYIAHLSFTTLVTPGGIPQLWWIEEGPMSKQFRDVLVERNLGLKVLRPISEDLGGMLPTMNFRVFSGIDKTVNQNTYSPIVFSKNTGSFTTPAYLFSIKDFKNVAYIDCKLGSTQVYAQPSDASTTGLNRRILYVDGGDVVANSEETFNQILPALIQKAKQELKKYNRQYLFDVSMTNDGVYVFNKDYYIGDYVTLRPEFEAPFGITMQVTEFVRTEDLSGYKEYPTLTQYIPGV